MPPDEESLQADHGETPQEYFTREEAGEVIAEGIEIEDSQ